MWQLRPFAISLINPLTRLFAGWMPGFGLLTYRGRATGRIYHLPINVFERGEHYIFVLTYGSESQWVKNVLAAGGCEPELIMTPPWELLPRPVQLIERLAGVTEFLRMRAA